MNTTELVDAVAEANDISKAKAKEVINSIFASLIDFAKREDEVAITGLGRFAVKKRRAKGAIRNPGGRARNKSDRNASEFPISIPRPLKQTLSSAYPAPRKNSSQFRERRDDRDIDFE